MGKKGGSDLSGFDGLFGEGTGASVLEKKEIWFLQRLSREERGVGHKREGQNHKSTSSLRLILGLPLAFSSKYLKHQRVIIWCTIL